MDIIGSIISIIFIGILVAVAVTFGFALLGFVLAVAFVTLLLVYLKSVWYRWRFVKNARPEQTDDTVIEADYEVIKTEDKKEG
ncbi:MAG: hypothetical protein ACN2B6_04935 [Rickettsiales bacterium]